MIHPSFQDFFSKLFSACDVSLNISTEYKIKLLEYLKLSEFGKLINQVVIEKKRLDCATRSSFCKSSEYLQTKKKIGKVLINLN